MSIVGDRHNFGQTVRRVNSPDGSFWFEKPRPVYWEWLLFGKDSPLADFFTHRAAIFGLTVEFQDDQLLGRSLAVEPSSDAVSSLHFFNFGYLLGYAYAFGIQDLFSDNLVKTDNGLQATDAEVVFARFTLPHESFLLPFRSCPFDKIGIAHLVPSIEGVTIEQVEKIVEGFCAILEELNKHGDKITAAILADPRAATAPIRVLLRESSDYRNWQTRSYSQPLLAEEIEQLERGDVPYFFKLMGGTELFYYSDSAERQAAVLPPSLEAATREIGVMPQELFGFQRIRGELFPRGVLFLLKKLLPAHWVGDFHSPHLASTFDGGTISVRSWWGSFEAKR